jgi:hypothetical protein
MLVLIEPYSRLGNRLILFSHTIATAIENDLKVVNPSFWYGGYAELFKTTRQDFLCRYPSRKLSFSPYIDKYLGVFFCIAMGGVIRYVGRIRSKYMGDVVLQGTDYCDLNELIHMNKLKGKRIIFLKGWRFRDPINSVKYSKEIKEYFEPLDVYTAKIDQVITAAKRLCDILVGVHIRRTDCRWIEIIATRQIREKYGFDIPIKAYYYNSDYLRVMERLESILPAKKVGFFICSDEIIEAGDFRGHQIYIGSGQIVEDLYSLAKCDYIFGPPSTYSGWAAYYGNVPLWWMKEPNIKAEDITLDRFQAPVVMNGVEIKLPNAATYIF